MSFPIMAKCDHWVPTATCSIAGASMATEHLCQECGYVLEDPDGPCGRCQVDDGFARAVVCSLHDMPSFVTAVDSDWEALQLATQLRETKAFARVDIILMRQPDNLDKEAAAIVADLVAEAADFETRQAEEASKYMTIADIPTDNTCLLCSRRVRQGLTLGSCAACASGTRH